MLVSEIAYQMKYAELNQHGQGLPWSFRHIEVYQKVSVHDHQNFTLVLHPRKNSKAQHRLEQEAIDHDSWQYFERNPLRHHLALATSYLDSWRVVLRHLGKRYQEQVSDDF